MTDADPGRDAPAPPETERAAATEATPRAFFGAVFAAVLDEIESNPAFAERLAERLAGQVTVVVKNQKRPAAAPAELDAMDMAAALSEHGQIELRERLAAYKNAELAAYVRARGLSSTPVSRMNKTQLLNAIIRAAR